jgi:two-component system phosphate regulon response regulator PhoB
VRTAVDGEEALLTMQEWPPDLVITDLRMPNLGGIELCRQIRAKSRVPIIVLSVKGEERTKVDALDAGADDYVTKPFSTRELVLRVKSLLRRKITTETGEPNIQFGGLAIDRARHRVSFNGQPLALTLTEFKLVTVLAERRGRVQSRDQLLKDVWGYNSAIDTRTVDTHMRRLRNKLGGAAKYLDTVRGVGYRFIEFQS